MTMDIFTVSELNTLVKEVISSGFPASLWVCGEIQNLDRYKSKAHLFFDLVEKSQSGSEIKAKIGVTIWAGVRPKIEALLSRAENAFELKDGIEVKFSGKVDYYPPYGTLRFVIDSIDPVYTLGKIAQDRQKLIAELTQSGVLAKNKNCSLSPVPLSIGLISAYDSAAYNDFLDELRRSGLAFKISFYNAVMQGKNCEMSVCQGLKALSLQSNLDAVVITRGGGSIAELSAFDSKAIALQVASMRIPVLTGIGHEINTSVTDLAAHTFAKTPTAIAGFLAERVKESLTLMDERLSLLFDRSTRMIDDEHKGLRADAVKFREITRRLLQERKEHNIRAVQRLEHLAQSLCQKCTVRVIDDQDTLIRFARDYLKSALLKMQSTDKLIEMASPQRTLKRGFSITRSLSGKIVRSVSHLKKGETLVTELSDGKINSEIK